MSCKEASGTQQPQGITISDSSPLKDTTIFISILGKVLLDPMVLKK
jgi:hypothetical protein